MEANCGICEEVLGDRPRTELLCHHFFHTECILTNFAVRAVRINRFIHHNLLEGFHCATCQQAVFPQRAEEHVEEVEQEEQEQEEETHSVESYEEEDVNVNNLYDTNEAFRNHIKKYVIALRGRSKPKIAFRKVCAAKKAELFQRFKQIKEHVQALHSVKKDEILQSEEYKTYKKVENKSTRYLNMILREYNLRTRDLRRLARRPGLRSLQGCRHYWRDNSSHIIRNALRWHVRCY